MAKENSVVTTIPFGAVLAIVIAAVIGAYYNSLGNGFHLDDVYGLIQNPWIHSLGNIPRFFVDPFTLTTLQSNADYRPVLQTTYAFPSRRPRAGSPRNR